jgi:hypothetical protein
MQRFVPVSMATMECKGINRSVFCVQQKTGGGIHFNATCKLTKIDEKMVRMILNEYSMSWLGREDYWTEAALPRSTARAKIWASSFVHFVLKVKVG